jgi:ABC-type phosphate/phosphonate transport system substrate-binding protein
MNLPRRLVAPLAEGGRFFGGVVVTGSHLASLAAIQSGAAEVASIDNVTFALLAEHRPSAVGGVRVLTTTAPSPTPPFVTLAPSGEGMKAALYESLAAAIGELRGSGSSAALHLAGIERVSSATYDPLISLEIEASALGYGTLA